MREAVIVDAMRTPVGRRGGALADWKATDLLAVTLQQLVQRAGVAPERLDDVIAGCGLQSGEQAGNVARWASLGAGLPETLPGMTIDRQCGSGQQAVHLAAQGVRSGEFNFAIGCGVETMSRIDLGPSFNPAGGLGPWYGERALARFAGNLMAQGPSAELVTRQWGLTREELDAYSMRSHQRAKAAWDAGCFDRQLVSIDGRRPEGGPAPMRRDEGIRPETTMERLAQLKPVFAPDGLITAGNSSQISDGAAAVLVADRATAEAMGLRPLAVIRSMAVAADDARLQFTAILPAARKALAQAGLGIHDIGRIEINEAFACAPLIFAREFDVDPARLNINGGSIAMGHPIGSTGARLMCDLAHELQRSGERYGLLTICEGGGMANATILERIDQKH